MESSGGGERADSAETEKRKKHTLQDLQSTNVKELGADERAKQMLSEISLDEDKIEPTYYPLPRRAKNGERGRD